MSLSLAAEPRRRDRSLPKPCRLVAPSPCCLARSASAAESLARSQAPDRLLAERRGGPHSSRSPARAWVLRMGRRGRRRPRDCLPRRLRGGVPPPYQRHHPAGARSHAAGLPGRSGRCGGRHVWRPQRRARSLPEAGLQVPTRSVARAAWTAHIRLGPGGEPCGDLRRRRGGRLLGVCAVRLSPGDAVLWRAASRGRSGGPLARLPLPRRRWHQLDGIRRRPHRDVHVWRAWVRSHLTWMPSAAPFICLGSLGVLGPWTMEVPPPQSPPLHPAAADLT